MTKTLALLTLLATLAFVISPFLTDPFSGFRADQLPVPQIDPPVQPAGYAFSIWGLIYVWLAVSAVFGLWKRAEDADWDAMRLPLFISLAVGAPWLWVANWSAIAATVLIFAMAVPAIIATIRSPARDRWLAHAPVAIYAGWLTAAAFVSLGSTAAGYEVLTGGFGWALLAIAGATGAALLVLSRLRRVEEYAATLAWALVAIVVTNGLAAPLVSGAAIVAILLVAGYAVMRLRAV